MSDRKQTIRKMRESLGPKWKIESDDRGCRAHIAQMRLSVHEHGGKYHALINDEHPFAGDAATTDDYESTDPAKAVRHALRAAKKLMRRWQQVIDAGEAALKKKD